MEKNFFTSTSEVYGKNNEIPFKEDDDRVLGSTTTKDGVIVLQKPWLNII